MVANFPFTEMSCSQRLRVFEHSGACAAEVLGLSSRRCRSGRCLREARTWAASAVGPGLTDVASCSECAAEVKDFLLYLLVSRIRIRECQPLLP
ncbi:hypothetical protein CDAR_235661 [Caerostris darwini]|uniref:Uncharacterized protein n=1 Tax=Caerostris darwini TaxID=1538125 RepID=A0AAV4WSR7_9ARAC|nr:hypothetical protein CDAR_235661 [Caerostris darwini]